MKNQISPQIKKERVNKLLSLSKELEHLYISKFIDQEFEFLIEQFDKKTHKYKGHSSNYLELSIKSEENLINKIVKSSVNFDSVKIS
jgi:threonylcarbamoyladenosine tRNA methylthiotransferase MtaB